MRWAKTSIALGVLLFSSNAFANDLAEALNYSQNIVGDWVVEGYEDFVDYDPDEALALLLSSDVQPNLAPERYMDGTVVNPPVAPFRNLGERLNFEALRPLIVRASSQTGLPVALIDAVIRTESGYRPNAVSRTGARGLMQLMPGTAGDLGVTDAFDPSQNIEGGARYLRQLFDRFGTVELAVAAYNAGPGNVSKHKGIPPFKETRRYVNTVLSRYRNSSNR